MARYGVLIEHDADGFTAWVPVIPGAYGYGATRAEAVEHLARSVTHLLRSEPEGLEDLDEGRDLWGVEAHVLEISRAAEPEVRQQRLVALSDIAEALAVSRQTVWNWARRHEDFPPPLAHTASGPIWALDEISVWAQAHGKDPAAKTRARADSVSGR